MSKWPLDWRISSLKELTNHITSGGTPTSGSPRYYSEVDGIPFAKTEDLTRAKSKFLNDCELYVTEVAVRETAAKKYPIGTILVSMYGTIGLTKITARELAANQALCALIPPFICDRDYLYHYLEFIRQDWLRFSGQTTQANINGAAVRAREIPLPPMCEQQAIAQIFDTLDTAIDETKALIDKLKAVKQGLLHDLLTRGVDANGQLRSPQSEAPHLYKESPLGWIPREWEVLRLDTVATRGSGHTPSKGVASYWNGGVKWVSLADSHRLDQIYIHETDKEISEFGIANSSAVLHPKGTVILSRDAGIGKSAILGCDMAVSQHFMAWICGESLNNLFLYFYLQREKPRFEAISIGSTIKTIGLPFFRSYEIAVPPRQEQDQTATILMKVEQDLSAHEAELGKLRQQKIGLMDDLLTGRVRVTPLLESIQQAATPTGA